MSTRTDQVEDYEQMGGTKLRLIYPNDENVNHFNYMGTVGALDVELANFGRFQTGTSIQAPVYYPKDTPMGCRVLDTTAAAKDHAHHKGFVLVKEGDCTFEEKARLAQSRGA